jgi:hypothetical protein
LFSRLLYQGAVRRGNWWRVVNEEHFESERLYQATIAIARTMLKRGVITADELAIIDKKMREKYKPLLGSLYPIKPCGNHQKNPNRLDFTDL